MNKASARMVEVAPGTTLAELKKLLEQNDYVIVLEALPLGQKKVLMVVMTKAAFLAQLASPHEIGKWVTKKLLAALQALPIREHPEMVMVLPPPGAYVDL